MSGARLITRRSRLRQTKGCGRLATMRQRVPSRPSLRVTSLQTGLASTPKSRHGPAMIGIERPMRAVALLVMCVLVSASTIVPSLSYAQKYADHLSQYGGHNARIAAFGGFASLYLDPAAPMLPVVLSVPGDADLAVVLPSSCSMDKTVLPRAADHSFPSSWMIGCETLEIVPAGLSPPALRGPPRFAA